MEVYRIEPNTDDAMCHALVAANDHNEAGRVFNEFVEKDFGTHNAIKQWKCCVCQVNKLKTDVQTPEILYKVITI